MRLEQPISLHPSTSPFSKAMARRIEVVRRRMSEAWTAVRLLAHRTIGVRVLADGEERLRRARRGWEFHRAMDRLEIRSGFDRSLLSSMTNDDEYGVVEAELSPGDVVIDIGAHIGGFSLLCHRRGSRSIRAFEPNPDNFAVLARNVAALAGVRVDNRAVFRSDVHTSRMLLSDITTANTGTSTLLFGGRAFEDQPVPVEEEGSASRHAVETVALDEILEQFERVRLLKLDCEGSEFPILLTSTELGRVDEIVGEYHEVAPAMMPDLVASARITGFDAYRAQHLVDWLAKLGFQVTHTPTSGNLGLFRAVRQMSR